MRMHINTRKEKPKNRKVFVYFGYGLLKNYHLWCVAAIQNVIAAKGADIAMNKEEIFEMVIREMTENALSSHRENLTGDEKQLYTEVGKLSAQARDIVKELPEEKQKILVAYFEKTNLIADHECQHLYVQGAKDCVEMLKKLGVL